MQVARKIYYDKATGNVIQDTGEREGSVIETNADQDFLSYVSLSGRVRETVGVLELNYGDYAQDFSECNGYNVNAETLTLEFSYPDPNAPEPQEPVYKKPLTLEVSELKVENAELKTQQQQLSSDFQGFVDYYFSNGGV